MELQLSLIGGINGFAVRALKNEAITLNEEKYANLLDKLLNTPYVVVKLSTDEVETLLLAILEQGYADSKDTRVYVPER